MPTSSQPAAIAPDTAAGGTALLVVDMISCWDFPDAAKLLPGPNAPKVGSGGSLSPRGDWRAPSDGVAAPWLADLERIPDDDG